MVTQNPDPYAVLRVSPTATQDEIAHAYRARVRAAHPDSRIASAPSPFTDVDLCQILAAYALIRTPDQRAHYDRTVARTTAGPGSDSAARTRRPSELRRRPVQFPITPLYLPAYTPADWHPPLWAGPVHHHLPPNGRFRRPTDFHSPNN